MNNRMIEDKARRPAVLAAAVAAGMVPMALCAPADARAEAETEAVWPRQIITPKATVVIYQPQLESFRADKLTARAAVSVTPSGQTDPIFGAVWIDARVSTDRDARTATLLDVTVPTAKFPNAEPGKVAHLTALLERELPKGELSISLHRLLAMLHVVEAMFFLLDDRGDSYLDRVPPDPDHDGPLRDRHARGACQGVGRGLTWPAVRPLDRAWQGRGFDRDAAVKRRRTAGSGRAW